MSLLRQVRGRWRRRFLGHTAPGDAPILYGGGALIVVVIAGFWAFATSVSPDSWVPVLVIAGLVTVSVPICVRVARADNRLRNLLLLALCLKLLAVFPRYYVIENVYQGEADTGNYNTAGQVFYQNVHEEGKWSLEGSELDNFSDETRAIGYIAGVLYLVVGTTYLGGFIVFSWLGWLGLMMFFRAFQVALPNAPPYLAAVLIFFLPSTLYWPSAIGKDAVMVFALGMLTLGLARLLTSRFPIRGIVYMIPAAALIVQVRPHILVVALVGAVASLFARNSDRSRPLLSVASRGLLLAMLVPGLLLGINRMNQTFGDPNEAQSFSLGATLEKTNEQTSIGGSAFETQPITSPIDVPIAVVSVLYRPFPFEVRSAAVLISALEGTALLVLTFAAGRWIWRIGPAARQHSFFAYCGAYVLAFVFAFSNVGNAGILTRQRVQMFPVLMLLVAAAREHHRGHLELPAQLDEDDGSDDPDVHRPETRSFAIS